MSLCIVVNVHINRLLTMFNYIIRYIKFFYFDTPYNYNGLMLYAMETKTSEIMDFRYYLIILGTD